MQHKKLSSRDCRFYAHCVVEFNLLNVIIVLLELFNVFLIMNREIMIIRRRKRAIKIMKRTIMKIIIVIVIISPLSLLYQYHKKHFSISQLFRRQEDYDKSNCLRSPLLALLYNHEKKYILFFILLLNSRSHETKKMLFFNFRSKFDMLYPQEKKTDFH